MDPFTIKNQVVIAYVCFFLWIETETETGTGRKAIIGLGDCKYALRDKPWWLQIHPSSDALLVVCVKTVEKAVASAKDCTSSKVGI